MNRTLKILMISDIFLITGPGLIAPILAIYIKEDLIGGTIISAGIASAIFLITKSLIQLPVARYVDAHNRKRQLLFLGTALAILKPFFYIFATHIYWIYFIQFLYGVGCALALPAWLGLWMHNLDKHHESFEWTLYSTLIGISTAISAAVGGTVAQFFGFKVIFLVDGLISILGFLILFFIKSTPEKRKKIPLHNGFKKIKNHF